MFHESRAEFPDSFSLAGLFFIICLFLSSSVENTEERKKWRVTFSVTVSGSFFIPLPPLLLTCSSSSCFSSHEVSLPLFFFLPWIQNRRQWKKRGKKRGTRRLLSLSWRKQVSSSRLIHHFNFSSSSFYLLTERKRRSTTTTQHLT